MGGMVPAYAISKVALTALTVKFAAELAGSGILINAVCPGWVRTPMADGALENLAATTGGLDAAYAEATKHAPARRPAEAQEVADTIAWLVSDRASGITGATLTIDGGAHVVDAEGIAFLPQG